MGRPIHGGGVSSKRSPLFCSVCGVVALAVHDPEEVLSSDIGPASSVSPPSSQRPLLVPHVQHHVSRV